MGRAGEALRQAFMARDEYERLPAGEKVWDRIAKPVLFWGSLALGSVVAVAAGVMLDIVFQITDHEWPACQKKRLSPLPTIGKPAEDESQANYLLTEAAAALYFWMLVFVPTVIVFSFGIVYLVSGICVAYTAPKRNFMLRVVENSFCASKRGGVRCLAILNLVFMIIFIFMGFILGSTILTPETGCSMILFCTYEVICWGLVFLHGGTAFFLHRKAAVIMDAGQHYGSRVIGMEMLDAGPEQPLSPDAQRRLAVGFKSWMGSSSVLSSSSDNEADDNLVVSSSHGLDDFWGEQHRL